MGLTDKLLDLMRLNDDDEDDFDNEDYNVDDEYDEVEETSKSNLFKKDKEEYVAPKAQKEKVVKTAPKITPITKSARNKGTGMEVCVIKPTVFEDSREITETLLNNRTVILNVEGLDVRVAQRIIDFTSGSCFAISGNLQKISNYIFIITPPNVDISGDFQQFIDSFDFTGGY